MNYLRITLFLAIFPIGMNTIGILICNIAACILSLSSKINKYVLLFLSYFLVYTVLQYGVNTILNIEVSLWQIFRTEVFLYIGLLVYSSVLSNKILIQKFFLKEHFFLGGLLFLIIVSLLLNYRLYPISLNVEGSYRIYIYSAYLFSLLFAYAFYRGKFVALIYALLIAITFQKSLLAYLAISSLIILFLSKSRKIFRNQVIILGLLFIASIPMLPMIYERFHILFTQGDNWRLLEIQLAFEAILRNSYTLFFGNGVGVPYREILTASGDYSRLEEAMQYDVHNLFAEILMKFGLIFTILYMWLMIILLRGLPVPLFVACIVFIVFQGMSSPALFHSIDTLGYFLGLSLLKGHLQMDKASTIKMRETA